MFQANRLRYGAAIGSFGMLALAYLVSLGWVAYELFLLKGLSGYRDLENGPLYTLAHSSMVLGTARQVLIIMCALTFLFWVSGACRILRQQTKTASFESSPTWAVLSFFVPLVHFVAPYRVLAKLWDGSHPSGDRKIVLFWWLSFVGVVLLGLNLFEVSDIASVWIRGGSYIWGIISLSAATLMMHAIHRGNGQDSVTAWADSMCQNFEEHV